MNVNQLVYGLDLMDTKWKKCIFYFHNSRVSSLKAFPYMIGHQAQSVGEKWENKTKWCNGFYIQFRQSFAKETFSYDEHLKS